MAESIARCLKEDCSAQSSIIFLSHIYHSIALYINHNLHQAIIESVGLHYFLLFQSNTFQIVMSSYIPRLTKVDVGLCPDPSPPRVLKSQLYEDSSLFLTVDNHAMKVSLKISGAKAK